MIYSYCQWERGGKMNKFGLTESDIYILENLIEKVLDND